jgi:hypothetical protein
VTDQETSMRKSVRLVTRAVSVACVTAAIVVPFSSTTEAQLRPESPRDIAPIHAEQQMRPSPVLPWSKFKQIPLTEK